MLFKRWILTGGPHPDSEAVFKVSLIRDFKGKLGSMRKVVDRAKRIGEQEETTEKEEGKLAEAEEALKDLDVEDCDVLGAFVTFTYIKFKDFVSGSGFCIVRNIFVIFHSCVSMEFTSFVPNSP